MIIDHLSNIKDRVYVWKEQILTKRVLSQMMRRETIKGFLCFTLTSFYHDKSSVLAFFLFLCHFISLLLLMRRCSGQHSYMSSTFLQPYRMLLVFITKRDGPCLQAEGLSKTNYNNIYKFLPLRYIFFTYHPIIIRLPYNQYLNYICIVRLVQ